MRGVLLARVHAAYLCISQPPHKANLNAPKKSVLVQLFKSMCCLSVVEDFRTLARFNIRELGTTDDDEDVKKQD